MAAFEAAVRIHLKPGALDPQGQAVAAGLRSLGHGSVQDVRVGKHVRMRIEAPDLEAAAAAVRGMCEQLLANPVMETYAVDIAPVADPGAPAPDSPGPRTRGTGA